MTDDANTQAQPMAGAQNNTPTQHVAVQKVYVKDVSFETPNTPSIFLNPPQVAPSVNFQMSTSHSYLQADLHEVVLKATVTVTMGEKTAFLVEVQQAGLFSIQGFKEEQIPYLISSYCPNILFPFVRETVSDTVVRGGFPQLLLDPINFDAVFTQQMQRAQQQAAAQAASATA